LHRRGDQFFLAQPRPSRVETATITPSSMSRFSSASVVPNSLPHAPGAHEDLLRLG
jgi:hypothetical protein